MGAEKECSDATWCIGYTLFTSDDDEPKIELHSMHSDLVHDHSSNASTSWIKNRMSLQRSTEHLRTLDEDYLRDCSSMNDDMYLKYVNVSKRYYDTMRETE